MKSVLDAFPPSSPADFSPVFDGPPSRWVGNRLEVRFGGRAWCVEREADMEALWERVGDEDFGEDERMPYWAELWPASLILCQWLFSRRDAIAGRWCLELGCGLGLTAMAGAAVGARVAAMDYEWRAVTRARDNAARNIPVIPFFARMDWRAPAFRTGAFSFIWGSDILYETRFHAPLTPLFTSLLAPGGRIWLAEPERKVSEPVWQGLVEAGFDVVRLSAVSVPFQHYRATVNLWEVTRPTGSGHGP
ncbi:class I SAM-dependent methyltransferase [Desulfolutivibrio sulfoxidireducens]|uniref:class I SAM-dependent methyltransferase n=1 Tax=Desulfolutivibrio sulfoxidireducens TaxID=2773299 RepID=UPI00159E9E59|nr:methyltransferase domain-containing protein [Desulfolutivibrio sulfoxidireducens]QLA16850.1 methyltransferase domain-containing protein [Desulfolutivibrio sulfoxidireducens]